MWGGDYQPIPKTAGETNVLFWGVWAHSFNISKMGCFLNYLIVLLETPHTYKTPFNSNTKSMQSHYLRESYRILEGGKSGALCGLFFSGREWI